MRGGGRVAFEAMLSKQLRLFASYEQSTRLTLAPEIAAIRSLRLIMEGTY